MLRKAEERIQKGEFAVAEGLLETAARQQPRNVDVLYRLGYVLYRQRKLAPARERFSAVVGLAPPAYYSRYFLGRIALLEEKSREAITWLEPILTAKEVIFDAAAQLAAAYIKTGEPRRAVAPLRATIAQAPWDGAHYYRLGQLYKQLGEAELAGEAFENSRRLQRASREDVETIMQTSQAISKGEADKARQSGATILDRVDADPNALVALGVVYGSANFQGEALAAFERAAQRDPELFQAQFNYGVALLRNSRGPEALAPLARAVRILPQSADANMTYGLASVMNQRYADAVGPLERAWKSEVANTRVGLLLATAYLRTGAAAKAVPILRQFAEHAAGDPMPLLLLVEALNATEDPSGALEAAQLAQNRFPKLPQAHMGTGQQLARLGRYQEARSAFEQTLKLTPGHPEAELGLADTLHKAGEPTRAAEHYRAAMNNDSTKLAARLGLARCLLSLRQVEDAQKILEEGLVMHPSDVALRVELARVYARLGKPDLSSEQTRMVEQIRARQTNRP